MTNSENSTQALDAPVTPAAVSLPARARPAPPLARHLGWLVAIAVLPLILVATVLIWRQALDKRRATEDSMHATARVLSVAVERELAGFRLMLQALASSDLIDKGDFVGFQAFASRVAEEHHAASISLFDPTGRQVINTRRPFGSDLPNPIELAKPAKGDAPPVGDADTMKRVFASGKPSNSDLYYGITAQRLLFTVDVPVIRNAKVAYVMTAGFEPKLLTDLLTADPEMQQVRAVIVDRRGYIVGRWQEGEKYTGVRLKPETMDKLHRMESGGVFTQTVDGQYLYRAFVRSPETGWTTLVALDADELARQERQTWLVWGSGALAALLLSVAAAAAFARRLDRSIVELSHAAAGDTVPSLTGMRSREIDGVRDALVKARATRADAMRALEAAVREEARRVEAEVANRDKDRFMAAVVHELRTPLAALSNVAALLQAGGRDERVIPMLQRQVAQLGRLVDDLMETSRSNVGKFQLKLARIDLRDVIRQAVEASTMRHRDKRQLLQTSWPPEEVFVMGDNGRLTQVVANLVDNAMKFTPPGGDIRLTLTTQVGHAVLRIVDSGAGIDPEFLPRVFDRFAQAAGTAGAPEGLGLGLAVARDLVIAHQGRIEVSSDGAGRGTTFTVTLPLA